MAKVHDLAVFYPGDDWQIDGVLHDGAGQAIDLTAAAVEWQLETPAGGVVASLAVGAGIEITDAANGKITIVLPAAETAAIAPGSYRDQCRATVNGAPGTQWVGSIEVKASFFAP
jgi:hypothetical protein